MYILHEAFRKIMFRMYQSGLRNRLSRYLYRLEDSRFRALRDTAHMLIKFKKRFLHYLKFGINTESVKSLEVNNGDESREPFAGDPLNSSFSCGQTTGGSIRYPKISIITPNYNQGRFLEGCIQSVLSQNYPHLEYIIIDGESTDHSIEIIRKYEDKIHFWISEKDNGQADAINKGLQYATGEIWNWLNSDDRLEPKALVRCAEAYLKDPLAAGWIGGCRRVDTKGNIVEAIYPNGLDRENIGENWNGKQFYQPSCFLSTAKVKEIGGLNPDLYIALDLDLWIRILEKGRLVAGEGMWSRAINHDEAKTRKSVDTMYRETVEVQKKYGFFEGAGKRQKGRRFEYTIPRSLAERFIKVYGLKSAAGDIADSFNGSAPCKKKKNICTLIDPDTEGDIDSLGYFLKYIFPLVLEKNWVEFHVLGKDVKKYKGFQNLHHTRLIDLSGKKDLKDILNHYRLFVCPVIHKRRDEKRILAAAAAGLPVVTTSMGAEGIPVRDGEECFISDSPTEFAEKCNQILNDPIAWYNFSIKSQLMIAENEHEHAVNHLP